MPTTFFSIAEAPKVAETVFFTPALKTRSVETVTLCPFLMVVRPG